MSTATLDLDRTTDDDGLAIDYRAMHTGSIIALVLGIVSVAVPFAAPNSLEFCLMVAPIPIVGIIIALRFLNVFVFESLLGRDAERRMIETELRKREGRRH